MGKQRQIKYKNIISDCNQKDSFKKKVLFIILLVSSQCLSKITRFLQHGVKLIF